VPDRPDAAGDLLTLQETADRLKVHYMTAYRWVRRGELPAFKTGGRLRVRADDVARFLREREVEVALPSSEARRTDWPLHTDRLTAMLIEGRGVDAGGLVRRVVADGAPAGEVYLHLLTPALHRIGVEWAEGRIGVAIEHRATQIAEGLMARLSDFFRRRGAGRGTAVTMTPAGDLHAIAPAMVADFLRAAGYDVHHLGVNLGVADLRAFLRVVPADLVAVSVTVPLAEPGILSELTAAAAQHGARTVVGGQGVGPEDVEGSGALLVQDLEELHRRLEAAEGVS
jgi:excisionase family DNA binding protein